VIFIGLNTLTKEKKKKKKSHEKLLTKKIPKNVLPKIISRKGCGEQRNEEL